MPRKGSSDPLKHLCLLLCFSFPSLPLEISVYLTNIIQDAYSIFHNHATAVSGPQMSHLSQVFSDKTGVDRQYCIDSGMLIPFVSDWVDPCSSTVSVEDKLLPPTLVKRLEFLSSLMSCTFPCYPTVPLGVHSSCFEREAHSIYVFLCMVRRHMMRTGSH